MCYSRWLFNGPWQPPNLLNSCSAPATSENIFWMLFPLVHSADAQRARIIRAPAEQPGEGGQGTLPVRMSWARQFTVTCSCGLPCGHRWVWQAEHIWSGLCGATTISASSHIGEILHPVEYTWSHLGTKHGVYFCTSCVKLVVNPFITVPSAPSPPVHGMYISLMSEDIVNLLLETHTNCRSWFTFKGSSLDRRR